MTGVVVSVSTICLCMYLKLVIADSNDCKSWLCFRLFSRKVDVDIHLFDHSKPLPIEDLIRKFGYPVEAHNIITEDGYKLTYHRIPHGKFSSDPSRPPVLLQHGLLGASSAWVLSQYSLAYTLADGGYDVWLGNARGNTYSRKHTKYDPDNDKKQFWDFSWHEMGYYDLPATIDYILNKTNSSQLVYIGHSMGTTMFFVLGATRPEYMDKVQAMVALAPVAFPWNIKSPLANLFSSLHTVLHWLAKALGVYEVFPYSDTMNWLDKNICQRKQSQFICRDIMFYIGGFDDKELNGTSLGTVLQYMPAGASYKTLRHFRQITNKGSDFDYYDYGYLDNLWKYKSFSPPSYNLSAVTAPVHIYYANNDWLSVPEDVDHVVQHLPNVKSVTKVPDDKFNHLDFMWAIDGKALLYDDIVSTLHNLFTYPDLSND